MLALTYVFFLGVFGLFQLVAASKEYLADIMCEITNSKYPQWPKFNGGRIDRLGYFDVNKAVDTQGETGHYMLAIGAKYLPFRPSRRVIQEIKIVASDKSYTPCPRFYWRVCGWDVDSGVGTHGDRGHYDISLCVLSTMTSARFVPEFVSNVILKASSTRSVPSTPHGHQRIGYWDVSGDSYSNYDGSHGHWTMGMYVKKSRVSSHHRRRVANFTF